MSPLYKRYSKTHVHTLPRFDEFFFGSEMKMNMYFWRVRICFSCYEFANAKFAFELLTSFLAHFSTNFPFNHFGDSIINYFSNWQNQNQTPTLH